MNSINTHEDYIAKVPEQLQPALKKLHVQLRELLPDADETIAYNMPGFSIGNKVVVGYAAFSKQCGIYLHPEAISSLSEELISAGFQPTKTGVKFSPENPIPEELLMRLVELSRQNIKKG